MNRFPFCKPLESLCGVQAEYNQRYHRLQSLMQGQFIRLLTFSQKCQCPFSLIK